MALLIICGDRDLTPWITALKKNDPLLDIRVYPDEGNPEDIRYALCWKHPKGILTRYPNLKLISSLGAGVDHLFNDPDLPSDVPIVRIVDPELAQAMSEFVTGIIFNHLRKYTLYRLNQNQKLWKGEPFQLASNTRIGIMGMGVLGQNLGLKLSGLGFKVAGWAQSSKKAGQIKVYAGDEEYSDFLSGTGILVCLLPLTERTRNILNKNTFQQLNDQAYVINVARGEHLVEQDLIEMIDKNKLSGASLDVFRDEPLPSDHPFWNHPGINITPHIASITNPWSVAPQIIENIRRVNNDQPLLNKVSVEKGY